MKSIDIFCASQASTAICMSMEQPSSSSSAAASSSSSIQLGGRTIDRHNPIIRDHRRTPRGLPSLAPCTSQSPPINPQPYRLLQKSKSYSTKPSDENDKSSRKFPGRKDKKSCSKQSDDESRKACKDGVEKKSWVKSADFITPPGSSRYLLSDNKDFIDGLLEHDPVLALVPSQPQSSSNSSRRSPNQVVVLRVSLHCRGCEGKVRKHLSKMEGVRSFSIDFAAKKVTIVGNVTPLGVLASVSKVKTAQFWTPPTSSAPNNSLK